MLRRLKELEGVTLAATDGDFGSVTDVFFDDDTWTVRYIVADTGIWLGRLVPISPISIGTPDWQNRRLPIHVSRKEIENSPDILSRGRLTREVEVEFAAYYGYPYYWSGPGLWGWAGDPGAMRSAPPPNYAPDPAALEVDVSTTSIFSTLDVKGYHIHATDGEIGHVDDFIIEDGSWSVRYLQIDTSNWIGGKTVLMATRWVSRIDPADGKIHVDVTRDRIENAPEYDPHQQIDRTFEERLHQHYGLPAYWEQERERERARARSVGASERLP
jgi:hypothetical protein